VRAIPVNDMIHTMNAPVRDMADQYPILYDKLFMISSFDDYWKSNG